VHAHAVARAAGATRLAQAFTVPLPPNRSGRYLTIVRNVTNDILNIFKVVVLGSKQLHYRLHLVLGHINTPVPLSCMA
jgi:hypothetical protein